MKNYKTTIIALTMILAITTATGCSITNKKTKTTNINGSNITADESGLSIKEMEDIIGFKLVKDTKIDIAVNSKASLMSITKTSESLEKAKNYYESELQSANYEISRKWGQYPSDNETQISATYTKNGKVLGIKIEDKGMEREVSIDLQH